MLEVSKWDVVDYLQTEEDMALYLEEAIKDGSLNMVITAIGDIARARSMNKIAKDIGVNRESLYKSLNGKTKVSFETIYKILDTLGLQINIVPKAKPQNV